MKAKVIGGFVVVVLLFALVWWGAETPRVDVPPPSPSPSVEPSASASPPAMPEVGNAGRTVVDAGAAPVPSVSLPPPPPIDADSALRGLETRELTATDRADLGLPERLWGGVVITEVDPTSPAAEARLAPNDVVFRAQGAKIQSMDDLVRAVGDRGHTRIQVYRKGKPFEVVLQKPFQGKKE